MTNLYALIIDGKIRYVSDDILLLQELIMDEYFDTTYEDWGREMFTIPALYKLINIPNPPEFKYVLPADWWHRCAHTSNYEIVNLNKYYIN